MITPTSVKLKAALICPADVIRIRVCALLIGSASTIADFTLTTLGVARHGLSTEGNPLVRSLLAAHGPQIFIPMAIAEIAIAAALLWSPRPLLRGAGVGWTVGMLVSHFALGAVTWLVP